MRKRWLIAMAALWIGSLLGSWSCEGLPEPKEVDMGKADRAMEQAEKGE